MSLGNWFRGLALLRYPELVRFLGQKRFELLHLQNIRARFPGTSISDVLLISYREERLYLGKSMTVGQGSLLAFGDEDNGFGRIEIGDNTWIGQYNNLRACGDGDILIGKNCLISQFCSLIGSNHSIGRSLPIIDQGPDRTRLGVTLEDDVWLGAGVVVVPGTTICRGAVIGANAVVTRDVPEYEIWAGIPAVKIGDRE